MTGMHAIVLAAGKGERLSPITYTTNKVLIEVGGRSILKRMVQSLIDAGIEAITIVTGHYAEAVEAHIDGAFGNFPIRTVNNPDYETSNNIVSLAVGLNTMPHGASLFLVEGDLLLDPQLIQRMILDDRDDLVLLERNRPGLNGTLARLEGQRVAELFVGERLASVSDPFATYKTVNVTRLSANTLDRYFRPALEARLRRGNRDVFYEAALADMIAAGSPSLSAVIVNQEPWVEVDDHHDLDQARFEFAPPGWRRTALDRSYGGYWNYPILDFAYPQNLHFPTAAIKEEMATMLPSVIGRYGSTQEILDEKLSRFLNIPAEQLVLFNGLSQIFPWLKQQFGHQKALIPTPCFGEYARVWPEASTYVDHGSIDMDRLKCASLDASVVVFVNPNNPTGTAIPTCDLLAFASAHPEKTVIVDESFADFSTQPSLSSTSTGPLPANILLLKSLGKSLGVSGLRLGYIQSSAEGYLAIVRNSLPVWNCNSLAELFLDLLTKHRREIAISLTKTRQDRSIMIDRLRALPCVAEVFSSEANFLLVRLNIDPAQLPALLDGLVDRHGIYVKDVSNRTGVTGAWIRLSVRTEDDNGRLYEALTLESDQPADTSAAIHR